MCCGYTEKVPDHYLFILKEARMQMKLGIVGCGVGIPKTNLGVGAVNIAKLYFRNNPNDKKPAKLNVQDLISIGGKSGAFLISAFETKWFELNPKKDGWARNANLLIGKKMQVEVYGVIAKWGSVDVVLSLFNNYNEGEELLNQCCVGVVGGIQFSNMKVQGIVMRSQI
jgi:hypothetical protein